MMFYTLGLGVDLSGVLYMPPCLILFSPMLFFFNAFFLLLLLVIIISSTYMYVCVRVDYTWSWVTDSRELLWVAGN